MLKKCLLILLLLIGELSYSQSFQKEKRIYLLDVTASMRGEGVVATPDIFETVKEKLINAIDNIDDPETEIVIIPFTNKPYAPVRGEVSECDSLTEAIKNIAVKKGDTNIADAWQAGVNEIDTTKINYLFLLTDGLHNYGVKKDVLYEKIRSWSEFSQGKYFFAFYVMLTPNAKETEIVQAVENTEQLWLIESMDVNALFVKSDINLSVNVNQNNKVRVKFTSNNSDIFRKGLNFKLRLEDNEYYRLSDFSLTPSVNLKEQYAEFQLDELLPRINMPFECDLKLYVEYDKENNPLCFFTPEVINFQILNKGVRSMEVAFPVDFGKGKFREPFVGPLKSRPSILVKSLKYPPFKWAVPDTLTLSRQIVVSFNEEALRSKAKATLYFVDSQCRPIKGADFSCNGVAFSNDKGYTVPADSLSKTLNISCTLNPNLKDANIDGFILVKGEELDMCGSEPLIQERNAVGDWMCRQKLGWPWGTWTLWILTALVLLAILALIVFLLVKLIKLFIALFDKLPDKKTIPDGKRVRPEYNTWCAPKEKQKEIEVMPQSGFLPWVGSRYRSGGFEGKRVMALGESHYCASKKDITPYLTINIIKDLFHSDSIHEGYKNTYTKFAHALSGRLLTTPEEKERFWNSIMFYNYVQVAMYGPRISPTKQDFDSSESAFFDVLNKYKPDYIIVWGKRLYNNMSHKGYQLADLNVADDCFETWAYTTSDGHVSQVIAVKHPSTGFTPSYWHKVLQAFIHRDL